MNKIDKTKLKLKYYLGVYSHMDTFPNEEDLLYEMSLDENLLSNKDVNLNYIKHLLSFKIENDKLELLLVNLVEQKYVECINSKKGINYKLLSHPWM